MTWNPRTKPPSDVCPERFCFHWAERGDRIDTSGGEYDTFEGAVSAARTVVFAAQCGCVFGTCTRAVPSSENRDWYEPNGRVLETADLPWFYFIAGPESVAAEFRERYVTESTELWGAVPKARPSPLNKAMKSDVEWRGSNDPCTFWLRPFEARPSRWRYLAPLIADPLGGANSARVRCDGGTDGR